MALIRKKLTLLVICVICTSVISFIATKQSYLMRFMAGTAVVFNDKPGSGSSAYLYSILPTPDYSDPHFSQATNSSYWSDAPLSIHEAYAQHKARTLETCNNSCSEAIEVCRLTTHEQWDKIVSKGLLPYRPFLARGQYVFEWEKHFLSYPPLEDLKMLPSLELSRVYVRNTTQGVVRCNISDTVNGRVDLVDGYGRLRTKGDDEVRVWIKSVEHEGFAASGNVTDMKNGSYLFTFRCLWPGNSKINIAVTYPREFLRVVNHQVHVGVTRYIRMEFRRGNITEHTLCWGTPNVPGRPCVCNITHNHQENFYCGRPKDARKAESRCITHKLSLSTDEHGHLPRLPPCHKADLRTSWTTTQPKGYWSPTFRWNSLLCEEQQNVSAEWARDCLADKTVWIFGDSNANKTYMNILEFTGCQDVVGQWPQKSSCYIPERGIKLMFTPHENPRFSQIERPHHYGSLAHLVDTLIPNTGKHICVFHFYLHYVLAHYSLVYLRLKALRGAVERLLLRNPNVVLAFRGPHILTKDFDWNHSLGGDVLAPIFTQMIRDWFKDLESRVIFLDAWDMSIGSENEFLHPPIQFSRNLMKTLLSFACE